MGKMDRNLAGHGSGRTHPRANPLAVRTRAVMGGMLQFVADRVAHGAAHDKQDSKQEGTRRRSKCSWCHSHPPRWQTCYQSHAPGSKAGRMVNRRLQDSTASRAHPGPQAGHDTGQA